MSLYNTNISSDEAGITISLPESMNDAYNRNDIDTVMAFFGEMHKEPEKVYNGLTRSDIEAQYMLRNTRPNYEEKDIPR